MEHIHMDKRTSERGMNTGMYVNTRRKNNGTLRCEIFFLGSLRMSSFWNYIILAAHLSFFSKVRIKIQSWENDFIKPAMSCTVTSFIISLKSRSRFSSLFFSFPSRLELKFSLANKIMSSNPLCSLEWCLLTFPWTKNYP